MGVRKPQLPEPSPRQRLLEEIEGRRHERRLRNLDRTFNTAIRSLDAATKTGHETIQARAEAAAPPPPPPPPAAPRKAPATPAAGPIWLRPAPRPRDPFAGAGQLLAPKVAPRKKPGPSPGRRKKR